MAASTWLWLDGWVSWRVVRMAHCLVYSLFDARWPSSIKKNCFDGPAGRHCWRIRERQDVHEIRHEQCAVLHGVLVTLYCLVAPPWLQARQTLLQKAVSFSSTLGLSYTEPWDVMVWTQAPRPQNQSAVEWKLKATTLHKLNEEHPSGRLWCIDVHWCAYQNHRRV